jgi:transcription antitermination factor NusG
LLKGKKWDSLMLKDDTKPRWYLLNCIAGTEPDCLYQCQKICEHFDKRDVVKFVVPTEPSVKSRGNKLIQENLTFYPGYVFAKVRLCERVYETLSGLGSVRSWMGTIRKQSNMSFKTKPSIPTPMSESEIKQYRGLEDASEVEAVETGPDQYNSTGVVDDGTIVIIDSEEDSAQYYDEEDKMDEAVHKLMDQFGHLEIGGMCKITAEGPMKNEDGIVKRFKDNMVCVRMYTYGSMFDEWIAPKFVRPLTEEEVRKGIQGPEVPITQQQFNVESLGMEPKEPRDRDSRQERSTLLASASSGNRDGGRTMSTRNRREDRVQRGDTRQGRVDGDALRKERLNWESFQPQQGGGVNGGDNQYSVDAQWNANAKTPKKKVSREMENAMSMEDDWSAFVGGSGGDDGEDAFFDDLLSELSDTPEDTGLESSAGSTSKPKNVSPTTQSNDDDDFFSALEESLEEELSSGSGSGSVSANTPAVAVDDDDFFAQLELELSDMSGSGVSSSANVAPASAPVRSSAATAQTQSPPEQVPSSLPSIKSPQPKEDGGDLSKLTVPMLKEKLKGRGLKVSGKKAELIARLVQSQT